MESRQYVVLGIHCAHCVAAVEEEVSAVPGVESVAADVETKRVDVAGRALDDAAIRAAIEEAGYEAA